MGSTHAATAQRRPMPLPQDQADALHDGLISALGMTEPQARTDRLESLLRADPTLAARIACTNEPAALRQLACRAVPYLEPDSQAQTARALLTEQAVAALLADPDLNGIVDGLVAAVHLHPPDRLSVSERFLQPPHPARVAQEGSPSQIDICLSAMMELPPPSRDPAVRALLSDDAVARIMDSNNEGRRQRLSDAIGRLPPAHQAEISPWHQALATLHHCVREGGAPEWRGALATIERLGWHMGRFTHGMGLLMQPQALRALSGRLQPDDPGAGALVNDLARAAAQLDPARSAACLEALFDSTPSVQLAARTPQGALQVARLAAAGMSDVQGGWILAHLERTQAVERICRSASGDELFELAEALLRPGTPMHPNRQSPLVSVLQTLVTQASEDRLFTLMCHAADVQPEEARAAIRQSLVHPDAMATVAAGSNPAAVGEYAHLLSRTGLRDQLPSLCTPHALEGLRNSPDPRALAHVVAALAWPPLSSQEGRILSELLTADAVGRAARSGDAGIISAVAFAVPLMEEPGRTNAAQALAAEAQTCLHTVVVQGNAFAARHLWALAPCLPEAEQPGHRARCLWPPALGLMAQAADAGTVRELVTAASTWPDPSQRSAMMASLVSERTLSLAAREGDAGTIFGLMAAVSAWPDRIGKATLMGHLLSERTLQVAVQSGSLEHGHQTMEAVRWLEGPRRAEAMHRLLDPAHSTLAARTAEQGDTRQLAQLMSSTQILDPARRREVWQVAMTPRAAAEMGAHGTAAELDAFLGALMEQPPARRSELGERALTDRAVDAVLANAQGPYRMLSSAARLAAAATALPAPRGSQVVERVLTPTVARGLSQQEHGALIAQAAAAALLIPPGRRQVVLQQLLQDPAPDALMRSGTTREIVQVLGMAGHLPEADRAGWVRPFLADEETLLRLASNPQGREALAQGLHVLGEQERDAVRETFARHGLRPPVPGLWPRHAAAGGGAHWTQYMGQGGGHGTGPGGPQPQGGRGHGQGGLG
ncbi:hypothetical protein [Hydrogenophaga sp.]|uniref:hypothetical protein n=1 Tax=Hydrogenophaga sp. TaxID=1904254 RepID=UPI00263656E1|nr:hypothetical protein [Hydrogenophaga sp.]MCW5654815.1 hypothetical protein [Hydrogenophaga sp.]